MYAFVLISLQVFLWQITIPNVTYSIVMSSCLNRRIKVCCCGGGSTDSRDFDMLSPYTSLRKLLFLYPPPPLQFLAADLFPFINESLHCLSLIDGCENRQSCWLPGFYAAQTGRRSFEGSTEEEEANSLGVWCLSLPSCLFSITSSCLVLFSSTADKELWWHETGYSCRDLGLHLKYFHRGFYLSFSLLQVRGKEKMGNQKQHGLHVTDVLYKFIW